MDNLIDWRLKALKLEAENIGYEDQLSYSGDEKWDFAVRAAKAISLAHDQVRTELKNPLPGSELEANYVSMKHLHVVARDGIIAMFWLLQEAMDAQASSEVNTRKQLAVSAALARLANDPKQAEMKSIHREWTRWQKGEVSYKSDSDFARKMMLKTVHLSSEGSVKNAITRWRKESSS